MPAYMASPARRTPRSEIQNPALSAARAASEPARTVSRRSTATILEGNDTVAIMRHPRLDRVNYLGLSFEVALRDRQHGRDVQAVEGARLRPSRLVTRESRARRGERHTGAHGAVRHGRLRSDRATRLTINASERAACGRDPVCGAHQQASRFLGSALSRRPCPNPAHSLNAQRFQPTGFRATVHMRDARQSDHG